MDLRSATTWLFANLQGIIEAFGTDSERPEDPC